MINSGEKAPGPEDQLTKNLREVLYTINRPTLRTVQRGVNYILAAIALVGREADPPPEPIDFTTIEDLDPAVKDALNSTNFYLKMQTPTQGRTKGCKQAEATAITYLTRLVNEVYRAAQAIGAIRSQLRHFQFNGDTRAFNDLVERLKCDINAESLAALVVFLTSGVKGLMTYSHSTEALNKYKLIHFLVTMDQLHLQEPIHKPIWKRTQAYILQCLMGGLFPKGIGKAVLTDGLPQDDSWQPVECIRWHLAHAIHLDFHQFCVSRSDHPDLSAFEIPRLDTRHSSS